MNIEFIINNKYYILFSYLTVCLITILTTLYISIESKNKNTLFIKKQSLFYKLRYITYIILYTPAHGIDTIKRAKIRSEETITLCASFWSSVLAFSIVLPISIVFISIYLLSISFYYIIKKIALGIKFIFLSLKKLNPKKILPEKIENIQVDYTKLDLIEYYKDVINTEDDYSRFFKFGIKTGILLEQLQESKKQYHSISYVARSIIEYNKKLKTKKKYILNITDGFISQSLLDYRDNYTPDSFLSINEFSTSIFALRLLLGPSKYSKLTDLIYDNKEKKKFTITQKQLDNFISDYLDELQESNLRQAQKYYDDRIEWVERPSQDDIDKGDLEVTILESPEFDKIDKEIYNLISPYLKEAFTNKYETNKKVINKTLKNITTYFKNADIERKREIKQEKIKAQQDALISKIDYELEKIKRVKRQKRIDKFNIILDTIKGKLCPAIKIK